MKKALALLMVVIMIFSMTTGCSSKKDTGPIRIGVIAPLSGGGTSYGINIEYGAKMAIDEINNDGGINGRKLEMVVVDDATNPSEAVTAMQKLVDQENVDVVVGGWGSSQVLAAIPVNEKAEVPYIVVGGTNAAIASVDNKWTFQVIKADDLQAASLGDAAIDDLGLKNIAVIYDTNDYGTGVKDGVVNRLKELGVTPVAIESYNSADTEFTAQLTKIAAAKPDGIALCGTIPAAPAIMIQARQLGIDATFFGTGGLANDQLFILGGEAAEGTVLCTYYHKDTTPDATEFAEKVAEIFANEKEVAQPLLMAWTYRSITQILRPCLEKAGTDKAALRDAIQNWRGEIMGFEGELYFGERHNLVQPTVLMTVKDGGWALYK